MVCPPQADSTHKNGNNQRTKGVVYALCSDRQSHTSALDEDSTEGGAHQENRQQHRVGINRIFSHLADHTNSQYLVTNAQQSGQEKAQRNRFRRRQGSG